MGRIIDLYVRAVQYSRNATWAEAHGASVARLADFLVRLRRHAEADREMTSGLIWGPAEHDRCHDPDFYFDINVWGWRGLIQLGRLHLQQLNGSLPIPGLRTNATYGSELLLLAAAWKRDIAAAASTSSVNNSDESVLFLPSVARAGQVPYAAMWQGVNSSYANFRYWSETILAAGLAPEYESALLSFRAERSGAIGGMSTYEVRGSATAPPSFSPVTTSRARSQRGDKWYAVLGLYMTYFTYCVLRIQSQVHAVLSQPVVQYIFVRHIRIPGARN